MFNVLGKYYGEETELSVFRRLSMEHKRYR